MQNEEQYVQSTTAKGRTNGNSRKFALWIMVLSVYMVLFCATGYIAFFKYEDNPAVNISPEWINRFEDPETRKRMLETLKDDSVVYAKKRELATQSFNVVLGVLLGFFSATAVSTTRENN